MSPRPLFKTYAPGQLSLLPADLGELIDDHHPVRIVNRIVDQLDLDVVFAKYKGGGTTSYHPRLLLKVWVYGYMSNIFSSRKLATALGENIHFMWLAGQQKPDHNTLNRFRSGRLVGEFKMIFSQVVQHLINEGVLDLKTVYTDGTKLEANANRYTFIWRKRVESYMEDIKQQLEELWAYTQVQAKQEEENLDLDQIQTLSPEKLSEIATKISERLADQPVPEQKQEKKEHQKKVYKANRLRKEAPERLEKYQRQLTQMGDRNSTSKTDPDATFMRTKDDHLNTGQLKPSYNLQVSANQQFIAHYSVHQTPNDTTTFLPHIEEIAQYHGNFPEEVVGDAAYGSEANYVHAEEQAYEAYLKYPTFHKESKGTLTKNNPYHQDTFRYDEQKDEYTCPEGKKMPLKSTSQPVNKQGLKQTIHHYQVDSCQECPLLGKCHTGTTGRTIKVNYNLKRLRQQAKDRLNSDRGRHLRRRRGFEVETVFGDIKENSGFRRLHLRGLNKVEIELGLVAIAYNLKKLARQAA